MQLGNYIAIVLGIIAVISTIIAIVIYIKAKKVKTEQDEFEKYKEKIKNHLSYDEFKPVLVKSMIRPFYYYAKLNNENTIKILVMEGEDAICRYSEEISFEEFKKRYYLYDLGIMSAYEILNKTE